MTLQKTINDQNTKWTYYKNKKYYKNIGLN